MKHIKTFETFRINEKLTYKDAITINMDELVKMLEDNDFIFPHVPYMGHSPENKPQWLSDNLETDEAYIELDTASGDTIISKEPVNKLYFYVNGNIYKVDNVSESEYDNIIKQYYKTPDDVDSIQENSNTDLTKNKSNSDGLGYAYDELVKIKDAIDGGRLKLVEGEKGWRKFIISVQFLKWARNLDDGYNVDVYGLGKSGHRIQIGNIKNGKITTMCDNFSFQRYILKKDINDIKFEEDKE